MSKSPKNPNNTGSKSASRHSKPTKKPVTIDLKPEATTTTNKATTEAAKLSADAARSSVPRSTPLQEKSESPAKQSSAPDTKSANTNEKTATKSKSNPEGLGRKPDNKKKRASSTQNQTSGLLGKFAAALVGGIVALSGAGTLQYFGVLGTPGGAVSALPSTYASVEDLNTVKTELTANLKAVSEKQESITGSEPAAIDETALSKIIEEKLAATNTPSELQKTLDKLQADIQKNSETLSAAESGSASETLTAALASIASLKNQIAKLETAASANSGVTQRMDGLEQAASEIVSIKENLAQLKSSMDAQKDSLSDLAKSVETGPDKKAAMAIAAAALKADVDRGLPFSSSLQTLQGVAGPEADFSQLTKFAEQGVPNIVAIANDFQETVSDTILGAMAPPTDNSLSSRLLAGAKSLVKVKQLSPTTGDSPEAVLSRIQAALSESKLQTASEEWQKLPEAGQAASKEWHEKLMSRITINNLIDSTVRNFLISNAG